MKNLIIISIFATLNISCNIFSPEGSNGYSEMKLVFTRENEIWLYDMLTEELEKLIAIGDTIYTNDMGFSFTRIWADEAKWSPDGKEIVFVEAIGTDGGNLKVLNLKTKEQRLFHNYVYRQDANPEWSADGTKIVFAKSIRSLGLNYEIFIVDANGKNETQITDRPYHADYNPTIHPDGINILFGSSYNTGNDPSQIFHTTINGDTSLQVTFFDQPGGEPEFDPVTTNLIYRKKNDNNSYSNFWKVSNMEFEHTVQITHSDYYKGEAAWSNDGNLIVYRQYAGIDGPYSNPEIWMMNADGLEQIMIIENGSSPDLLVN